MPSAQSRRFAAQITWLTFRNDSGQSIAPYSIIMGTGWSLPDVSGDSVSVKSPFLTAKQPDGTIAPYNHFITGSIAIPAGAYGSCARPDTIPLLCAIDGGNSDTNDAHYRMLGPTSGSFRLTRDLPGFLMLDLPQKGYALVCPSRGPYRGITGQKIGSQKSGTVTIVVNQPRSGSKDSETQTSQTITAYNGFDVDCPTNQRVSFDWIDNGWELLNFDPCPPSSS